MKKRFAIITDIHGNIEGLNAILKDIENKKIDEIICLGDTIDIGPNSKECIDKLIDNNIKITLGNHELYLLRGTSIDQSINNVEGIEHYKWVKNQLSEKEINFIKKQVENFLCLPIHSSWVTFKIFHIAYSIRYARHEPSYSFLLSFLFFSLVSNFSSLAFSFS